jgi:hypothetical protein
MPTSARARSPKHRKPDFPAADSLGTATEVSASTMAATASYFWTDTEPTAADLDLSSDPELLAIPDPADIGGTVGEPSIADLTDPDAIGELDPDQTISLPDAHDDLHDDDLHDCGDLVADHGPAAMAASPTGDAS